MTRFTSRAALVAVALILLAVRGDAALPIRKPDAEAAVEKVVAPTEAEKAKGVLVIVFLKDRKDGVAVTKDTPVHIQMGKLVPLGRADDIKAGQKLSVWIDKAGGAEGVLIFP